MAKKRDERKDNRLDDPAIKRMLKAGKRFEVSDGAGLTLAYRKGYTTPVWRLRYRIGGERGRDGNEGVTGRPRVMVLGKYPDTSLADARESARKLRARVTLGFDVAAEKQERLRAAVAKADAKSNGAYTVAKLADAFFDRYIDGGKVKHPGIVLSRIEKRIKPAIGHLPVADVRSSHIDDMLHAIVKNEVPTIANDVLRLTRRIFNYALKIEKVQGNPASAFTLSDAGGKEEARDRHLSGDELVQFFEAMRKTKGLSVQNVHTFKLLLLLAVRKQELTAARVDEFDLDNAMWALPANRTKTDTAIDIPLSPSAVRTLRELVRLGERRGFQRSDYLLPARKAGDLPHIHENTLNVALSKVHRKMGIKIDDWERRFTVHDFRRTARTALGKLGVPPHIAERCLNHKVKGVEGTYDRHEYFDERREALEKLAAFIDQCEAGKPAKAEPTKHKAKARGRK